MEILDLLTIYINDIFIKGLFISILSIMIIGKILKTDTRNAFTIIKWLILIYAGSNNSYYLMVYFSPAEMTFFVVRNTGPYIFAFYLMLISNTILPLLLLFKKIGRNRYVVLTLSFLMNIGWVFELFMSYSTYTGTGQAASQFSFSFLWFIFLKGVFMGSVVFAIGSAIKPKMPSVNASST